MTRNLNRDKERRIAAQQEYPSFLKRPSVDLTAADIELQDRTDWIRQCNREVFIMGAEWADEHPRKGLVDIDKVCNWLSEHFYDDEFMKFYDIVDSDSVIEGLRKAMEE